MKTSSKIPVILRQYREQHQLTGKEVVSKLKDRGIEISEKTLLGYESGVGTPRVNTFIALCDIYQISDIMGEFGYESPINFATGQNEWELDLYNDFFNATLLEKIFILLKHGIPSFAGYEDKLEQSLPTDATAANYDRLYRLFSSLDEPAQNIAVTVMQEIVKQRYPATGRLFVSPSDNDLKDLTLLRAYHAATPDDRKIIDILVKRYTEQTKSSRLA